MSDIRDYWHKPTKFQKARSVQLENRKWFDEYLGELQKELKGKTIAVYDKKVVAIGATADEVKGKIKGNYPEEETLIILVPSEEVWYVPYPE